MLRYRIIGEWTLLSMNSSRILLVEDDPEQGRLFAAVLAMDGHEIITAGTAEEAITRLAQEPFALAIIDWDLPGMMGDDLILLMKADYPGVKTLLFSNHNDVNQVAEAADADASMKKMEGIIRLREIIADLLQVA